jgi:hypothetical protein
MRKRLKRKSNKKLEGPKSTNCKEMLALWRNGFKRELRIGKRTKL